VDRRKVTLGVKTSTEPQRELGFRLEVAAPLPKGDRAQYLVEKLTELGATRFIPLRTQRSVVLPRETRREKLERYVIEASKQCGRNVLLQIEPLTDWASYCVRDELPPMRLLAHPWVDPASRAGLVPTAVRLDSPDLQPFERDMALTVGPEGGFTEEEISEARAAGWQIIDLGPRILRVETAALVLASCATQTLRATT
jgi:16S rRNA (uracil1498-N3)-methyltransferase